jgi:2-polyprenyl-6-methoxyphenol hydroxylase-like FAD-dependent oxidoreductase
VEGLSPTRRLFITQIGLEPVLRDHARALGAEHHYATEMVGFEQDERGVVATLRPRDGGAERTVRARYMIAADGAHSAVREKLGIPMGGRGSFADCVTIYFKADMRAMIGDRNLSVVYVSQPGLLAFFRFAITGDAGFLAVFATFDAEGKRNSNVGRDLPPAEQAALVRAALGVPADFPVQVDNVQRWSATAATATHFRQGNVFLAGDAAHVMPPTGGFGGNTGVADAHNLAWKLAMVLNGTAGPALLDSYEPERRPLCDLIVEQAYTRYIERVDPSLPATNLAPELDDPAIELGSIYRSAALIGEEGSADDGALVEDPHHPSGRPGTRIPHVVLHRGEETLSTHDLPDHGFVLIAGARGTAWRDAAAAPLKAYRVAPDGELQDPEGLFEAKVGIGPEGAILVRPDGVIGWRSAGAGADPRATLDAAMKRLTFR